MVEKAHVPSPHILGPKVLLKPRLMSLLQLLAYTRHVSDETSVKGRHDPNTPSPNTIREQLEARSRASNREPPAAAVSSRRPPTYPPPPLPESTLRPPSAAGAAAQSRLPLPFIMSSFNTAAAVVIMFIQQRRVTIASTRCNAETCNPSCGAM
jgi:hypothetical protein